MATVTATPADMTITLGYFTTSKDGTISWTTPTVPSGATITSVKLTGTVTASNSNVSSIVLNGQSLTVSTSGASFTIDLGTDNSKTSLSATAKKSSTMSNYNVKFTNMVYTVEYQEETYTVIFKDENGNILKTVENVEKGYAVRYISPSVSKDGYAFLGWVLESDVNGYTVDNVNKDMTLVPKYVKHPKVVITQNEGGYFTYNDTNYEGDQTFQMTYNSTFEIRINMNDGYGLAYYSFKYINESGEPFKSAIGARKSFNVSLDMKADYDVVIKYAKLDSKFTVTFKDYDGTVLKTITDVTFGASISSNIPDDPIRTGYKFESWAGADISDPIVEDTVFVAEYREALTLTIIQNYGGYFMFNGKRYDGHTVLDFTDAGVIDADLDFYCNEGYYYAYTHLIDADYDLGEEERGDNGTFGQGWQGIGQKAIFKVEYARLSAINKENIIIDGQYVKEAYLGDKPIRIYRSDDRIL